MKSWWAGCLGWFSFFALASGVEPLPAAEAPGAQLAKLGSRSKMCRSAACLGENPALSDACFARTAIGFRCLRRAAPAEKTESSRRGPAVGPGMLLLALILLGATFQTEAPADPPAGSRTTTGLVYGDIYLRHETGSDHHERPQRLEAIVRRLRTTGLMEQLTTIRPVAAEKRWLLTIHSPGYIDRLEQACLSGLETMDSLDTPVCEESFQVALAAVGGVLSAVDAVVAGRVRNAFCAIRPPGHHALPDRAMGFCLLSNVAIATRYVQKQHNLRRVLIVDWDVHHGNGTQAAFYSDPDVLYFSVHRERIYPGTGSALDRGSGNGRGTTINVPLPAGSGDREYQEAFERLVPPARDFKPDFVFISAGFDAARGDPLGGMRVSTDQFAAQTRVVRRIADEACQGRLVSVLEGGYALDALADGVEAHVRELSR